MTATTAESNIFDTLNRGRWVLMRFYAYLGLMIGISAMAMYATDGTPFNDVAASPETCSHIIKWSTV